MTPIVRKYRRNGAVLDFVVTMNLDHGVFFRVDCMDKTGNTLEAMEFRFDESTVRSWIRQMATSGLKHWLGI